MYLDLGSIEIISYFTWMEPFFLWYFGIVNVWGMLLVLLGSYRVYQRSKEIPEENLKVHMQASSLPEISILMPFYNEEQDIFESLQSVLNLSYQHKKMYLINDGSEDRTCELLIDKYKMVEIPKNYEDKIQTAKVKAVYRSTLVPELFLIDKEHRGKWDSSNAGINAVTSDYLLVVDTDTILESAAFEALIRPLFSAKNLVCVGSSIRIKNGVKLVYNRIDTTNYPPSYIVSMQAIEYIRSFLSRLGWDTFNGNFIIAGAFTLFPTEVVVRAGGYADTVGEDAEIVMRLHRIMREMKQKYRIFYIPEAIAWTDAEVTYRKLENQRTRWHVAILEALFFHKKMFFNPRYGFVGMFIFPLWVLGEALEPIIEVIGITYIIVFALIGQLHTPFFVMYLGISMGIIFVYTVFSIITDDVGFKKFVSLRSVFLLFTSTVAENIGYHQASLWWRLKSFPRFIRTISSVRKRKKEVEAKIAKAKSH